MNRTTTIVLFAGIFAVAVGTLGLSGNSSAFLMAPAAPQSQDNFGMLGHVQFTVMDDSGNIKQYLQGDNEVVNNGEDCAAEAIFGASTVTCQGVAGTDFFTFVGIGNGPTFEPEGATNQTLADAVTPDAVGGCFDNDSLVRGELARIDGDLSMSAASGTTGTQVVIDTSNTPFQFNSTNSTNVITDSGLFNGFYAGSALEGHCPIATTQTANTDWEMFARQNLNTDQGIVVTDGDSLSVKWTITVG